MIRVREVEVITDDGERLGTFPTAEALEMASDRDMDLVEVSPNSNPPVCKLMDFGKFKYKQNKKAHEAKKNQRIIHVKEVKFRPNTDQHDYDFKLKNIIRFLDGGDKVKAVIFFRGREIVHRQNGERILQRVVEATADTAIIEQSSKQEGRTLTMILAPKGKDRKGKPAKKSDKEEAAEKEVTEKEG